MLADDKRNQPAHEPKFSTEWPERVEFRTMTYLDFNCVSRTNGKRGLSILKPNYVPTLAILTRIYSGNVLSLYCYTSHAITNAVWFCAWRQFISHSSIRHSPCPTWAMYPCRTKLQRFFLFVLHLNFTSIKQLRLGPSNCQANLLHDSSNACDECIPAMDLNIT